MIPSNFGFEAEGDHLELSNIPPGWNMVDTLTVLAQMFEISPKDMLVVLAKYVFIFKFQHEPHRD